MCCVCVCNERMRESEREIKRERVRRSERVRY